MKANKVLIVCSGTNVKISPFVDDQIQEIRNQGWRVEVFQIRYKGMLGYLKASLELRRKLRSGEIKADLIHAHFGLSGLAASLQNTLPLIITFHGSDIHQKKNLRFSKLAMRRSERSIFVSEKLKQISGWEDGLVLPCGVDTEIFLPKGKDDTRRKLNMDLKKKYVLFSSTFLRSIKNPGLAIKSIKLIENAELLELKGLNREGVSDLMNAVDVCLLTSFDEGSPQFIKEAMSCNRPIVSTRVGDVENLLLNEKGIFFTDGNIEDCVRNLKKAIEFSNESCSTDSRSRIEILNLSNREVVSNLILEYNRLLQTK